MSYTSQNIQRTFLVIAAASTLLIAGCGKPAKSMTFQDGYHVLTKNIAAINIDKPMLNEIQHDVTTLDIQAASKQGFTASGSISSSGVYASGNALIELSINATAFEPSFNASVLASGAFRVAQLGKTTYGYIDNVTFKPISGSADGGIIEALASTMSKKWIDLTAALVQSGTDQAGFSASVFNAQAFSYQLTQAILTAPLFTGTSKTMIDGNPAYALAWDPVGVSGFVHTLLNGDQTTFSETTIDEAIQGILNSPIVGYLIIRGANDVSLRIDSITTSDAGILSAQINSKSPSTWQVIDSDSKAPLMTGMATLGREGFTLSNSRTAADITLSIAIPPRAPISMTLSTKDIQMKATVRSTTSHLKNWTPPTITDAIPFSRIQEGFSLLGGDIEGQDTSIDSSDASASLQTTDASTP